MEHPISNSVPILRQFFDSVFSISTNDHTDFNPSAARAYCVDSLASWRSICPQKSLQCPNTLSLHDCSFSLIASSGTEMDTTLDMVACIQNIKYVRDCSRAVIKYLETEVTSVDRWNSNGRCYFISNTLVSAGSDWFQKTGPEYWTRTLEWPKLL